MKKGFYFSCGLLLLALLIFITPPITAELESLEVIDTDKTFNPFGYQKIVFEKITDADIVKDDFMLNEKSDYPVIAISDTLLWFETDRVAEYKITENTDYCAGLCYIKGKAVLYKDGALFDDAEFLDLKRNDIKELSYKYYIKTGTETYNDGEVLPPKEICENGICRNESQGVKSVIKTRDVWTEYKQEELKAGNYEWKLEGKKNAGDVIDAIPIAKETTFGEWVVWNSTFTNGLVAYYNFEDSNSTSLVMGDAYLTGTNDTMNITKGGGFAVAGKIGIGYEFNGANTIMNNYTTDNRLQNTTNMTVIMWVYPHEASCSVSYDSLFAGGTGFGVLDVRFNNNVCILDFHTDQGTTTLLSTKGLTPNAWNFVALVADSAASRTLYVINATATSSTMSVTSATSIWTSGTRTALGKGGNGYFHGWMDEVGIWNRALKQTEILSLWDNANGTTYSEAAAPSLSLLTSLVSPNNSIYSSNSSQTFEANATATNGNVTNMTLYLWGSSLLNNYTNNLNNSFNSSSWVMSGLSDYNYTWNVLACARNSTSYVCNFSTNRSILIDSHAPSVNITYPLNTTILLGASENLSITWTVSDLSLQTCILNNGSTNFTVTCSYLNSSLLLPSGSNVLTLYANDSLGSVNSSTVYFFINRVTYVTNYTSAILENTANTITFNLSYSTGSNSSAILQYNGTIYNMTQNLFNATLSSFSSSVTSPSVTGDTLVYFNITYILDNSSGSTIIYNQTVYNIPALNFTYCSPAGLFFTLADEENLTALSGNFYYNFKYGTTNSTEVEAYGKAESAYNLSVCPNFSISPSWTLGYGEIYYNSPDYADRRYYTFSNLNITNQTQNITLYNLLSSKQTSFKLEVEDTSLNPYNNVFTTLVRWYPDLDEFKIVDMGLTDETGSTVIHVKTEDVDYRIGVYERNGTLIKLANPIRMVCLVSPCTYTLKISPEEIDYTSFLGITYDLDFNYTTGMWLFTYSDDTGKTNTMNLTVWKDTGTSSYIICSSTTTGAVGAVSCNTSLYTGTLRAQVVRSASPGVIIVQKIISTVASTFKSPWGLFLSFLLAIPVMFMLVAVSPIAAIIGGVVALIPALYFGSINWIIFSGFIALGGIIINFIKRT